MITSDEREIIISERGAYGSFAGLEKAARVSVLARVLVDRRKTLKRCKEGEKLANGAGFIGGGLGVSFSNF